MKINSLAQSDQKYLVVQLRPTSDTILHVQILAPEAKGSNRNYGFALDIIVPTEVMSVIKSILEAEE